MSVKRKLIVHKTGTSNEGQSYGHFRDPFTTFKPSISFDAQLCRATQAQFSNFLTSLRAINNPTRELIKRLDFALRSVNL
ncbi:hypothetical protein N7499_010493 [Penicillium canescens]|nr:hypothetical protein N7499_010493 [Penicillium canescens]KAJ6183341.1 hypothetical protein N7485_001983 [Penicillium canescens]